MTDSSPKQSHDHHALQLWSLVHLRLFLSCPLAGSVTRVFLLSYCQTRLRGGELPLKLLCVCDKIKCILLKATHTHINSIKPSARNISAILVQIWNCRFNKAECRIHILAHCMMTKMTSQIGHLYAK